MNVLLPKFFIGKRFIQNQKSRLGKSKVSLVNRSSFSSRLRGFIVLLIWNFRIGMIRFPPPSSLSNLLIRNFWIVFSYQEFSHSYDHKTSVM